MKKIVFLSIVASATLMAADNIGTVTVEDVAERLQRAGALKDSVKATEVIGAKKIQKKQATNLTEAIANEPGVQSAVGCSMCGMKRLRINGMKGEYTSVMVDGVPMYSTVSSYYGMDALATAGVSSIEIARGAGASLIAPGGIGGVINVKSKKATRNGVFLNAAGGNDGYRVLSAVGTGISKDKKTRVTLSGQDTKQAQVDNDHNGVSESPFMENQSLGFRISRDITDNDNLNFHYIRQTSHIFGGPKNKDHIKTMMTRGSEEDGFVGGDVRKQYIGDPVMTMEVINTRREEVVSRWLHAMNDDSNLAVTGSYAHQIQDSVYEGQPYYSDDKSYYESVRYNTFIGEKHFVTVGSDSKIERMRSLSNLAKVAGTGIGSTDAFNMGSIAMYVQDIWTPIYDLEISTALRADHIVVNWLGTPGTEIDKTIVAPRLNIKYNHENGFTSRLSAGRGYRTPLTFFESEHGLLGQTGFALNVKKIEKSNSAGYSLNYDKGRITATASVNWTQMINMAYIQDGAVPTLQNAHDKMNIITSDIVGGYQLTKALNIGASYEHFNYDKEYKALQFLAQVENRAKLMLDYESNGWTGTMTGVWIGSRNLSEYGYHDWNRKQDVGNDALQKNTTAPSYYTVDGKISKKVDKNFTFYAGVKNLFNYTQVSKQTPLVYDTNSGYDVGYIWGPLRGRQIYAGLQAKF